MPVWGTVLSDPLPIEDLVGRYPANHLMGRMPVPDRFAAFTSKGCPSKAAWRVTRRFHRLSARRGWVAYALRTRPPLSPAPKGRFPFDLHVLGLPLAFILSQDQTLHCTIDFLNNFLCCTSRLQPAPSTIALFLVPPDTLPGIRLAVLASDCQ